jgi:hypothetical protein
MDLPHQISFRRPIDARPLGLKAAFAGDRAALVFAIPLAHGPYHLRSTSSVLRPGSGLIGFANIFAGPRPLPRGRCAPSEA